ncbi:MAG: Uncharacterized protein XD58_0532 [Thermotoga sp. 50_1627]|uniref:hypothetical protein n=1 Tax=Pseudothermotoga sp. TaxID=2033661 RepID=UPI00076CCDDE|nr:MAG: Uncharacterized protein XD45_0567 [Thermotoga sp. 50_64]KUK25490.1 MAG: Uncharacterized protein XD58_0532 [Thermotoga sp. 50_1627]MBC7115764.1 hypothetical protein [Pseudothermotoga sp.]MDK2922981.1 hypothetical protein [Pseudothermotoga sp.]HBT38972.1 hypothetical protein [Pseudothermotoga sp.]
MKKAYLSNLKLFDSSDACFPLDFDEVLRKKKAIFVEFLSLDAQEFLAWNLFGDLAMPKQIERILSLVPTGKMLRLSEENVTLEHLALPSNVSVLEERDYEFSRFSSNPVEVEKPFFFVKEDDEPGIFVESSVRGCKPVQRETFSAPDEGQVLYTLEPFAEDKIEEFARLQFYVFNSYRVAKNDLERRLLEKVPEKLRALFVEMLDLQG